MPSRRRPTSEPAAGPAGLDTDPETVARTIALRLLDHSPRSRADLEHALARRGVPAEAATAVLDRFTEVGLIDDAAFAAAWVDSRHAGRRLGRRALATELYRHGIDRDLAEQALANVSNDDELIAARALVDRRLRTMRGLDHATKIRRLTAMLGRKGFSAGLAGRVVRDALAQEGASQEGGSPGTIE
ncbi:MAG TPA: regulatory protein RecX [Mycobacteriales bacterium]|nr:regulatory protein RecX [Mycobacteriales bacterium]